MEFLGTRLDHALNRANAAVVSAEGSLVRVRVMKTDEAIMIARYAADLIRIGTPAVPR
jgi:acetate kinase